MICCSVSALRRVGGVLLSTLLPAAVACHSGATGISTAAAPEGAGTAPAVVLDDARGGRLYDKWYAELDVGFVPGHTGGPRGDGTLVDGRGEVVPDDGHGYRLKNLFGWDLRGPDGIYGPRHQNKPWVRARNLLEEDRPAEAIATWLEHGDDTVPRFGDVLPREALDEVAAFVVGVRTGALPRPDEIWDLSDRAPQHYTLRPGAAVERGHERIAAACGCHGPTGLDVTLDGETSLGEYTRAKAYEAWFKILNGHPGTEMAREIDFGRDGHTGATQILEILAALCDRGRYPPMTAERDVPDDDPRCGPYLR
jgi:hypothetical protein